MTDRNIDVVRQARERLEAQELVDRNAPQGSESAPPRTGGRTPGAPNPKDDKVLMYRGRVIRGGGGAPGAPRGGRAPKGRGATGKSGGSADVKAKLQQLSDLFNDGLLTKDEYDRKRAEIISQL